MDRISDLPKIILHDILSRLPEKDVARTSVLSTTWHDIWSSFPILVFDGLDRGVILWYQDRGNPQKIQDYMRKLNNFLISVDNSLQRFHDLGFAIKEFNVSMIRFDPQSMPTRINHWMKIASESGVQVLKLGFRDKYVGFASLDKHYGLPLSVLEAKSLGHEQALLNLISSCPLIENLTLNHCRGLEAVRIRSLPKLKVVKVVQMQEVDVDVPCLENLYIGTEELGFPCKIIMDKCSSLRELIISYVGTIFVSSQWLLELLGKFPLLGKLELDSCIMSERIKISSACIDSELKEAEIDAPNLESCKYCGLDTKMLAISFLNTSIQLEFNVCFRLRLSLDFERLKIFIQSIKPRNVLASVTIEILYRTIEFNMGALQDISLPSARIKLLNLCVCLESGEELCLSLVTGLFWSFPHLLSP